MTNLRTKLISLALAACMLCAAAISVSAAEISQSGGSGSTPVNLTTTNGGLGGEDDGQVTPTKLNVTVPTALPLAMSDDGTVVTATDCKIVNHSYGAVRVKTVTISAASDWNLTSFGDKDSLAGEKVDSNKLGFALSIGNGKEVMTKGNASTQRLIAAPMDGCYMTGVGNPNSNSVSIEYAAIVTPMSGAVNNTTIANVIFVIEAVTVSTTYTIMSRCGMESPFTHEDFLPVFEFNTPATIAALGTAVSQISEQVLRDIEITIKIYEKERIQRDEERTDLHQSGRLFVPEPDPAEPADEVPGQVRQDAPGIPEEPPSDPVQQTDPVRETALTPDRDRYDSERSSGTDDGRADEGERSDGKNEVGEPDTVGADDEQPEITGGGNDSDGTDLQLSEPFGRGNQLSLFDLIPMEAEQIEAIDKAESEPKTPFAFSFSQEEIDTVLRFGSNMDDHRKRIVAEFMKQKSLADPFMRDVIAEETSRLAGDYAQNRNLLRFHHVRPDHLAVQIRELGDMTHEYAAELTELPEIRQFITEDEIAESFISHGSGIHEGKYRLYDYLTRNHSDKEKIDFLKNEYGTGGHSHALSGSTGSWEDHDSKGIRLKKSGCADVEISWTNVLKRLQDLIYKDRYLTQEEKDAREALQEMEEEILTDQYIETEAQTQNTVSDAPAPDEPVIDTVAVYPAEENHLPYDVVIQTIRTDEPKEIPPENFRITDNDLGTGGAKTKFCMNMDAIGTLKQIESEKRHATPEEQEILSKYVGWGGLADAFDDSKENWRNEYAELSAALTPEEYTAARSSTLNAHYTSPTVIKAIYEAVGNMGFQTGNILEPAMGVGNFFGLLPEEMAGSKLYGVELDSITGRIAKQLYPNADITIAGFETTDRRDFFDLAVGNVPFGNYKVNDRAYNKLGFSIHDYFFAKTLDQVRPGGVIAFVTSRYTMDKQSPEVRKYIAERADLLGAIRLPNNAFKKNAGTEVTTDILFLQKRDRPQVIEPDWVHLGQTPDGITVNSYFVEHPEMVLGTLKLDDMMYGDKKEVTCEPLPNTSLADLLKEAVKHIGGQYKEAELPDLGDNEAIDKTLPADPNVKNYSYTVVDGEVYYRENSIMVQPNLNATAKERVKGMVELRDCVHDLIDKQLFSAGEIEIIQIQNAFIVCTHVDKSHIHSHIIFNSTTLDCKRKFKDFLGSGRAVGRLSDIICLEHGLSIIRDPKRYTHSTYDKWLGDKKKPSHRELLRGAIDNVLAKQPGGFDAFLQTLNEIGYISTRRGKNISFRHPDCKNSIRMNSLGEGYTEADIRSVLSGERKHTPKKKRDPLVPQKDSLLIDIQRKMAEGKGTGYANWAKKFNIKQMAQTVNYLREHGLMDYNVLKRKAADATEKYNRLSDEIKSVEKRMAEIAVLKTHIINYSKTRDVYTAYRKAGYYKKFLAEHESDILLHKAAKKAFDELGVTKLPTIKSLQAEYTELLAKKKAAYTEYRTAREEMKELLLHKSNIDRMLEKEEVTHDEQKKKHEHRG